MVVHGDLFDVGKAQCSNVHCNEAQETQSPLNRDHDIVRAVERSVVCVFLAVAWGWCPPQSRVLLWFEVSCRAAAVAERQPIFC
jgi:hypothetical protein